MTATNPALAGLRDIHLPDAISLWPIAPGWWILFGLGTALGIYSLFVFWRRQRDPRRVALHELDDLEASYDQSSDSQVLALGLSVLLRRLSLVQYDRSQVAVLHGSDRAQFLKASSRKAPFPSEMIEEIESVFYSSPNPNGNRATPQFWIDATRNFIRRKS